MDNFDPVSRLRTLSETEVKILHMKCQGMEYEDIGIELGYSISTIQLYASTMYQKLGFEKQMHSSKRMEILRTVYCPEMHRLDEPPKPNDPDPKPPHEIMVWVGEEIKEERDRRLAKRPPTQIIDIQPPSPLPPPPQRPPCLLYLLIALLSIAVLYLLAKDLIPTLFTTPIATIVDTKTPFLEASMTPEGTPEETVGVTPSGPVVIWETHFDEGVLPNDWVVETTNVQPVIQDGYFVAPSEFRFTVGDGTWKDISVTVDFVDSPCWAGIGLRGELALSVCNNFQAHVYSNDLNEHLPNADFKWPGNGKLTFSVKGDRYDYHEKYIIRPGNPTGVVWIKIPGGTRVRKITVTQLP